jgi:hypothetical protein
VFFLDMQHRGYIGDIALDFPLERLNDMIDKGEWNDLGTKKLWEEMFSCPYQLWEKDPSSGGVLKLQDIQLQCPKCDSDLTIGLVDFIEIHMNGDISHQCSSCHGMFHAAQLQTRSLKHSRGPPASEGDSLSALQRYFLHFVPSHIVGKEIGTKLSKTSPMGMSRRP